MTKEKQRYSLCCRTAISIETKPWMEAVEAHKQDRAQDGEKIRALHQTVRMLMGACKELMAESGHQRAANWEIINDAMIAGGKVVPVSVGKGK